MTKDPIARANETLAYLESDGRLTEQQANTFMSYMEELIRAENEAWLAAKWHRRLWYRMKCVYWKIRGWERVPFNVKVIRIGKETKWDAN